MNDTTSSSPAGGVDGLGGVGRSGQSWTQPFAWGLLMVLDPEHDWESPDDIRRDAVTATGSCVAVPVRHTSDFDSPDDWPDDVALPGAQVNIAVTFTPAPPDAPVHFDGVIACPSGRLEVGDAENARLIDVPAGPVRVQVSLSHVDDADNVLLRLLPPL